MMVVLITLQILNGVVNYDDSDFTSNEMCCACGGGERAKICSIIPYQPATICVDTDHDNVNSDGYPCSYLNILHDNENIAYDCDTQADTSTFTASSMCCACGGGITLESTSRRKYHKCVVWTNMNTDSRGLLDESYHVLNGVRHIRSNFNCCVCWCGRGAIFRHTTDHSTAWVIRALTSLESCIWF